MRSLWRTLLGLPPRTAGSVLRESVEGVEAGTVVLPTPATSGGVILDRDYEPQPDPKPVAAVYGDYVCAACGVLQRVAPDPALPDGVQCGSCWAVVDGHGAVWEMPAGVPDAGCVGGELYPTRTAVHPAAVFDGGPYTAKAVGRG